MVSTPVQTIEDARAKLEIVECVFRMAAGSGSVGTLRPALLVFRASIADAGLPLYPSLDALLELAEPHSKLTLN